MLHSTRMMLARPASGGGGTLDTQTITVGGYDSAFEHQRGFIASWIGSISDGTSNIYGGAGISELFWGEAGGDPFYELTIAGAANSGWTTMMIGSTSFTRASAAYSAGTWNWAAPSSTVSTQAFGSIGGDVIVTFS